MRSACYAIGALIFLPLVAAAGEKTPLKQEYAEFSRLIHSIVVKQMPKEIEDTASWGQTVPVEGKLPFPLLRKYVKVGDKTEVPHGAWRRSKGRLEDPNKNLKIVVKDFKKLDDKTHRLVLDVDATLVIHAEWQQWQKGLLLFGGETNADARVTAAIVCDVGVSLNLKTFPPVLNVEPKVKELELDLVEFKFRNFGPLISGDQANVFANDFKEVLRTVIKASEPLVKEQANQAIAQSLKEGKGMISATTIMKALPASR